MVFHGDKINNNFKNPLRVTRFALRLYVKTSPS